MVKASPSQRLQPEWGAARAGALPAEAPSQHQAVLAPRDEVAAVPRELQTRHILVVAAQDDQKVPRGNLGRWRGTGSRGALGEWEGRGEGGGPAPKGSEVNREAAGPCPLGSCEHLFPPCPQ